MRPGPRMIDQNALAREHPHHRHGQASNDIPLFENMWTEDMITKEDVAEPGQKAIDFSGGQPKNPQSGQQFNNKKEMQNTMHKTVPQGDNRMTHIDLAAQNGIEYTDMPLPQNTGPKIFQGNPTDQFSPFRTAGNGIQFDSSKSNQLIMPPSNEGDSQRE